MPETKKFLDSAGASYLWSKIKTQLDLKAAASDVSAVQSQVTTLIGSDSNKSVRTIANEELAAQLITVNADESLDSLQEIAAWIQSHPGDASAMNSAITALQSKVTLGTDANSQEYATVKAYVEAYVAAQLAASNLSQYATAAQGAKADTALQPADVIALTNAEIDTAIANATSGGNSGS